MGETTKRQGSLRVMVIGGVLAFVIQIISAAVIAYLILNEKMNAESNGALAYIILAVGAAIGAMMTAKKAKDKIALSAAGAVGIDVLLLGVTAVGFLDGLGECLVPGLLCILGGYVIACAICIMQGEKSGKRKRLAV